MLNARSIWAWIWKYDFVLIIFGIGRKIMLDIKLLRNNFEEVEKALSTRNEEFDLSLFKDLDEKRRNLLGEVEALRLNRMQHLSLFHSIRKKEKM